MKKPILKGPKLIAVGPLKCFKGGGSGGGGGGGSCFIAGTLVTMADGSKRPIEKVLLGEKVKGLDGTINTVMEYNRPPLAYSALGEVRKLYSINGGIAFFTDEHPFYTTTGWKSLNPKATYAELKLYTLPGQEAYPELIETAVMKVGDEIVTEDGTVKIETIEEHDADFYTQLYNFILDGDHTYLANGYVVHNGGGGGKGGGGGSSSSSKGGSSSSGSSKPKGGAPSPAPKKDPMKDFKEKEAAAAKKDKEAAEVKANAEQAAKEKDEQQQAVRDATKRKEEMAAEAAGRAAGKKVEEDARQQESDVASIEKTKKSMTQAIEERNKAIADQAKKDEEAAQKSDRGFFDAISKGSLSEFQDQQKEEEAVVQKQKSLFDEASKTSLEQFQDQQKEEEAAQKKQRGLFDEASKTSLDNIEQQKKDVAKIKQLQKEAGDEGPAPKKVDDRGFFKKLGDVLYTGSAGAYGSKEVADRERKAYDDTKREQGISEARRLGRPVIRDGVQYNPDEQTPEEAESERQSASDLGIGVDQFREEMAAEAEAGPEAKGIRETASLQEALAEREAPVGDESARAKWEGYEAKQKAQRDAGSKMMADWEGDVRKKQAEMDLARGNIKADEYEAVTGEKAPVDLVDKGVRAAKGLARGMVKKAVSPTMLDPEGAAEKAKGYDVGDLAMDAGLAAAGPVGWAAKGLGLDKKVKEFVSPITDPITSAAKSITDPVVDAVSGVVSPITKPITDKIKSGQEAVMGVTDKALGIKKGPVSFQEAVEARAEEKKIDAVPKAIAPRKGDKSKSSILAPAAAVAATALAPKPKPYEEVKAPPPKPAGDLDIKGERGKLVEDLKKQASGEESLAEKQVRRTQDRSLAQRLAALKSMRGQDAGSKLRSFSKASDKARREAEGQIEIAGMKERRSAQDQLRSQLNTMSQEEATERWKKIGLEERQRLLKMNREDAIAKGEYNKWLTVTAMGQKFFKDEIKDAGDWVGTNVLDPIKEGGKKILKKGVDFVKGAFGFEEGGHISGPGSETSDSIPARLSDGEFVIKSSAVRGLGKVMGGKGKEEEREKGVDFLYKLQDKMDKAEKFAEGGEAYVRPKKAFREAIGYEPESRFHDKAEKDAKHGGARRKFRHFQQGGQVSLGVKSLKPQFNVPQAQGYGSVVAAQKDLDRRIAELERQLGR